MPRLWRAIWNRSWRCDEPRLFCMTSGVSFPFAADKGRAITASLREKEFGYRKKRLDLSENYSLYFYRLHRRFGGDVMYRTDEEE